MISVAIATHNGALFIEKQLESILNQLSDSDQVIISDDGSTDGTIEIIQNYNDPRIKLFTYKQPINPYNGVFRNMVFIKNNFENALKYAKGEIIFISDQDDIWIEGKVEKVKKQLETYDCVIHDCSVFDSEKIILNSLFSLKKPRNSIVGNFVKPSFMGCCMALKKEILNNVLPFPDKAIEYDTWIGFCALKFGKIRFLHEPLILYRRHGNNVSYCYEGSKNSLWIKFKRRYYIGLAYINLNK